MEFEMISNHVINNLTLAMYFCVKRWAKSLFIGWVHVASGVAQILFTNWNILKWIIAKKKDGIAMNQQIAHHFFRLFLEKVG